MPGRRATCQLVCGRQVTCQMLRYLEGGPRARCSPGDTGDFAMVSCAFGWSRLRPRSSRPSWRHRWFCDGFFCILKWSGLTAVLQQAENRPRPPRLHLQMTCSFPQEKKTQTKGKPRRISLRDEHNFGRHCSDLILVPTCLTKLVAASWMDDDGHPPIRMGGNAARSTMPFHLAVAFFPDDLQQHPLIAKKPGFAFDHYQPP